MNFEVEHNYHYVYDMLLKKPLEHCQLLRLKKLLL